MSHSGVHFCRGRGLVRPSEGRDGNCESCSRGSIRGVEGVTCLHALKVSVRSVQDVVSRGMALRRVLRGRGRMLGGRVASLGGTGLVYRGVLSRRDVDCRGLRMRRCMASLRSC